MQNTSQLTIMAAGISKPLHRAMLQCVTWRRFQKGERCHNVRWVACLGARDTRPMHSTHTQHRAHEPSHFEIRGANVVMYDWLAEGPLEIKRIADPEGVHVPAHNNAEVKRILSHYCKS